MRFETGSLVKARGREWVVLPDSTEELLMLKPLSGSDDEITGVLSALEQITPARFDPPDPSTRGDHNSCRLLYDALRLSFRNSAGPFRSFGKLAVEPRPYQLVPLMMALRLETVRLLISDDVGIGKTIESCLILRELLDRGEIRRSCVLCPPHLAEQWKMELTQKFGIPAVIVSGQTVARLERDRRQNQSLFEVFPHTVVSIDYIKSDRHRDDFLRTAPRFVIVDEAHEVSFDDLRNSGRHQRFNLVKRLAADPTRHLVLVTATPHSGNEGAFRSLLSFLDPDLTDLPADLKGPQHEKQRLKIAEHFIQRRRVDIESYLENTVFPVAKAKEHSYTLSPEYKELFAQAMDYARRTVSIGEDGSPRHRVQWWAALTLLRALASSPAAAAATMRNRSLILDSSSAEEADAIGRRLVMDSDSTDGGEVTDTIPGSDSDPDPLETANRRQLLAMARLADQLRGEKDAKMLGLVSPLKDLIKAEFSPIVFCRFIQTAEYLAEELSSRLKDVEVVSVTGALPPEERENRIAELAQNRKRLLVCTDCLSEGVNLQDHFDAVIHYDLSWNPTRHEQREGRVDRFRQPHPEVRIITYYGTDNQIDGIVLNTLLRKHKQIKTSLGISVPVPKDSDALLEAIFEGMLLREKSSRGPQMVIDIFDEIDTAKKNLENRWEDARQKEMLNRTIFAQRSLASRVDEISTQLEKVRSAIGSAQVTESFFIRALNSYQAVISPQKEHYQLNLGPTPSLVKESCRLQERSSVCFQLPAPDKAIYLSRTHPQVEALAELVLNAALEQDPNYSIASRCGVFRTKTVHQRTVLLLIRFRLQLKEFILGREVTGMAEDAQILAYHSDHSNPEWLPEDELQRLLDSSPSGNVLPQLATAQLQRVLTSLPQLQGRLDDLAKQRAALLMEDHSRVRRAVNFKGSRRLEIRPELPADILGLYVYLPDGDNDGQS